VGSTLFQSGWYSEEWLEDILRHAPEEFNSAFDRWRELYRAAMTQMHEAQQVFFQSHNRQEQEEARRRMDEANRQRNLLCNIQTAREESDFYPYRYLASEGFLPGYNFPRLPVRAFIPRGDGEFITRPRYLAITEFGPQNIIYHEGAKYQVGKLIALPGGLQARRSQAKLCQVCGYFQSDTSLDFCNNCNTRLDASTSEVVPLLEMCNVKAWRRERITCDEEERLRLGYDVTTHYCFAPAPGGQKRTMEGTVYDSANVPRFRLVYAPAATLFRINHGWRNRKEKGFVLDLATGEWLSRYKAEDKGSPAQLSQQPDVVRIFVRDSQNLLLLYYSGDGLPGREDLQATLQYALCRGIEQTFQIEESELASERIGSGSHRAILFWETSEGGVGVLRRLVEEQDALAQVALAALERCHFDPKTLEDRNSDCACACYECLLSYSNQGDYARLNRHLVRDLLVQFSHSITHPRQAGRDYEEHYRWLRSLTDTRSELERRFIDYLYSTKRRLPDEAQKPLGDYFTIPDFFCQPNICIFCDGAVHDHPEQKEKDRLVRQELKELGYRVIIIRYDQDLEEQIQRFPDIFGQGKA
jgi:very-short-patch-repair endonuclease